MSIYEVTHIYDESYFRKDRKIIMVGNNKKEGILNDACFKDNISFKNPTYCELTAVFAIYKNFNDSYVGIEHYRRYFCDYFGNMLSDRQCESIIKQEKIILPIPQKNSENNYLKYCMHHYARDINTVRDIIYCDYKDYSESFDMVMFSNKMCYYNMIVCDKHVFDQYCAWLFELLEKLEIKLDISSYNSYQSRIYGFLSERLLNIWVLKNIPKEKIEYRYIKQVGGKNKNKLWIFLRTIKENLKFA